MPLRRWIESMNCAIEGVLFAARTQRHLRYHLYSAAFVLVGSYALGVERTDFLVISIAVILVLLAEMVNTAVEYVVDMISPEFSDEARVAKDVAAGAVLVTAVGAIVVGYIVLFPYLNKIFEKGISVAKHTKEEIALISIIIVLILVVVSKAFFGKGHPLRGGLPSGHSAVAFSAWVTVTHFTESFTVSLLAFVLATAIAQSRVATKVHTPLEVVIGGVLGAATTWVLFLLFQ